jgi:hypothetical protein
MSHGGNIPRLCGLLKQTGTASEVIITSNSFPLPIAAPNPKPLASEANSL